MRIMRWVGVASLIAMAVIVGGCDETSAEAVTSDELAAKARAAFAAEGEELPACCQRPEGEDAKPQASPGSGPEAAPHAEATATEGSRASNWLAPTDRPTFNLDYTLTNQDGRPVKLADLRGKPMAITFFFTRCPLPTMCPLIVTTTARLQDDLAKAGLGDDVQILLISYDPTHDTPEAMKKYGDDRGLAFTNAAMLRPSSDNLRQLISEFEIGVQYYSDGTIGHFIEMILIDRDGRYVRDYTGQIWDNAQVLADLKNLVAEPAAGR